MISMDQVRTYMVQQSAEDKKVKSIQVEGESVEDALEQASVELGIKLKKLEYEVIDRGDKGVFGIGRKMWVLQVYEATEEVVVPGLEEEIADGIGIDLGQSEMVIDQPGEAFVRLTQDGVFLKVSQPVGSGAKVNQEQAIDAIRDRNVTDYDSSLVAKVVKRADSEYVHVGSFDYRPSNDALMRVEVTDGDMKAYLQVQPPGAGGTDLSFENIIAILKNNGISHGIKEDVAKQFEDRPEYNIRIFVAEGTQPVNGQDAKIVFNFSAGRSTPTLKERNGKVDFKELNLVENVVAGQLLAKKIPPEEGKPGRTVTGTTLPAKSGKDGSIDIGKNVKLSEDELTAISEINGQVLLVNEKINVEPIYTVEGDVDMHEGNILFLGTVIVKGNVEDGFSVKAAGNIEVMGNVGKCVLDAEGDIIVHQGILGKSGGHVKTGRGGFAKFIEQATIEAGEYVVASEGIIHSYVDSNKKVICQGKRASIVGGRLRAAQEINAKNLGSVAGSETILEVGYDPKSKERMVELEKENNIKTKELEDVELNIKTLSNLKKVQKKLPEDKEQYLTETLEKRTGIVSEIDELTGEMEEIKERLASIKQEGKIGASDKVFAGVEVFIKDANLKVRSKFKNVTFVLEQNNVKVTKYEPIEEEFQKKV